MSVIVDTYCKCKRKHPDRLVLFESGMMASFILQDAYEVSRLLGEPLARDSDFACATVTFTKARIPEVMSRLRLLKYKLVGLKREGRPPRRWIETSLEPPPDVSKIVFASNIAHEDAIAELKAGKMETDWLWFTFPRMAVVGNAMTDAGRGFSTLRESRLFFKRKIFAARLRESVEILLSHQGKSAEEMFGKAGSLHLKASATLFALTAKEPADRERFALVLQQFFAGTSDAETIATIKKELMSRRDDTPRDLVLDDDRIIVRTRF